MRGHERQRIVEAGPEPLERPLGAMDHDRAGGLPPGATDAEVCCGTTDPARHPATLPPLRRHVRPPPPRRRPTMDWPTPAVALRVVDRLSPPARSAASTAGRARYTKRARRD